MARKIGKGWLLFIVLFTAAGARAEADDLQSWLRAQKSHSIGYLERNISPPGSRRGALIASPSRKDPDYYYVWTRDASIGMREIVALYVEAKGRGEKETYRKLVEDYVDFVRYVQTEPGITGIGDPKFYVSGKPYTGPWPRPQNDGPAARAITLIRFANQLLSEGEVRYVRDNLYGGGLPAKGAIKIDLEYLSHHWTEPSFGIWEEIKGHHFYTQVLERHALLEGADLAARLGDSRASDWYLRQANGIETSLSRYWNEKRGVIVPTVDKVEGPTYEDGYLDSQVPLATLDAKGTREFMTPVDSRMLATVKTLEDVFARIYPINHKAPPGVGTAIGRFPSDRYDGHSSKAKGNPWFFTTEAFAHYYYELALRYAHRRQIRFDSLNGPFFLKLGLPQDQVKPGKIVYELDPLFKQTMKKLLEKGDSFMRRVRLHANHDGTLSEQFNRETGYEESAENLSLSYAEFLAAMRSRDELSSRLN